VATTTELPIKISVPAADRFLELETRPRFRAMIEHPRQSINVLRLITVSLDDQSHPEEPTTLMVAEIDDSHLETPGVADESAEWRWDRWAAETFPPDVLRQYCMMAIPAGDAEHDGR
jgi:hypothetical protein